MAENPYSKGAGFKVVYVGPPGAGKRTAFDFLRLQLGDKVSEPVTLTPESQPVIYLEIQPGNSITHPLALYTASGAEPDHPVWEQLFRGAQGLVFMADSQTSRGKYNIDSMSEAIETLARCRQKLEHFPFILHYNKRDLTEILSIKQLEGELNPLGLPAFNTIASAGSGLLGGLNGITHLIAKKSSAV